LYWAVNGGGGKLKGRGEMGLEKFTGEIKKTHKIIISKPERKRHFGRSRHK